MTSPRTLNTRCSPLALTWALLGLLPGSGAAQGVNLANGYTDFTTWSLFGSALAQNTVPGNGFQYSNLFLTSPGVDTSAGAGFAPDAIVLDTNQPFVFDFHFFIPAGSVTRGDGMTFTLAGAPGLGGGGSELGYGGLAGGSLAFAIDTFHFSGDPVSPSLQILQDGSITPLAFTETNLGDAIRDLDFQWYANVSYTPSGNDDETGTLTASIQHANLGLFTVDAAVDLSSLGEQVLGDDDEVLGRAIFYGFTAGSGLADDGHVVTSAAPVPVPAAVWLLSSAVCGLGLIGRRASRRSA